MSEINWRQLSIEQLEKRNWGSPDKAPTEMVKRCIILSKIPLHEFTASDLRLMIEQGFALQYLIPLALEKLKEDLFLETDYFPGDLLKNILSIDVEFWRNQKNLWEEINALIKEKRAQLKLYRLDATLFYSAFAQCKNN